MAYITRKGLQLIHINGNLPTPQYLNLAIDFGAVAVFGLLAKFDLAKQAELEEGIKEKIEKKKEQQTAVKGIREREKMLETLSLNLQLTGDGQAVEANVKELQRAAKQHMILVAGPKRACKDALIGANLLKMDFAMSNVLVVPYETNVDPIELQTKPSGTGFGNDGSSSGRASYENQPYVARPVGDGWDEYMAGEIADAVAQNGIKAKNEGIAIVIANNGKVLRRGVGRVPWRQMVEELNASMEA